MPSPGPRAVAALSVMGLALVLALAAALAPASIARSPPPTNPASDPGYAVVPWANESVRILDSRTAWLPPLISFTGPGLLLSDDPYAADPAAVAAISSPAPNGGIADYDYATGATRNLTFPASIAGAFSPGDVMPFVNGGGAYLLSLSHLGTGVIGPLGTYAGTDVQIAVAGILDVPAFAHFVAVNLSLPLTSMGFAANATVYVQLDVVPDSTNLTAVASVSVATGGGYFPVLGPPWAKFVYAVDLATATWPAAGPLVLTPRWTLPWSAPVSQGYLQLLAPSELLVVAAQGEANVQVVDLDRGTWKNVSLPGQTVVWHGTIGGDLYLLAYVFGSTISDTYALDRIDRNATGAATGVALQWELDFPRPSSQSAAVLAVTGGRLDVFEGSNGNAAVGLPTLTSVSVYDLLCGTLLATTDVGMSMGLLPGTLGTLAYPSLNDIALYNGFLANQADGLVYELNLPAIRDAAAAVRNETPCASCTYAVTVTRDAYPHLDLLVEEQYAPDVFGSSPVSNLTAVELTASGSAPGILPVPPGGCRAPSRPFGPPVGPSSPPDPLVALAFFGLALLVLVVPLVYVARPPRRRGFP